MTPPLAYKKSVLVAAAMAMGVALAGCDKDPSAPNTTPPSPTLASDSIIPIQGAIRVAFNAPVSRATALNPSNFVVTNACTGLPVPGALTLAGDTVVFTPSQALPYLTAINVRVQGVLNVQNQAMPQPVIYHLRTQNPPVSDISWKTLTSPTNDPISGVSFLDRQTGFLVTLTGSVFATTNGGSTFAALFKSANITTTRDLRAVSSDTLYMVGAISIPTAPATNSGLLRSIDGGLTFQPIFQANPAFTLSLAVHKRSGSAPEMIVAGGNSTFSVWRFDQATDSLTEFGPTTGNLAFMADLAPDGNAAVAVGALVNTNTTPATATGIAYRSTDGGRTFTPVTLPAGTRALRGVGFIDNASALLLGDTSTVLRLDATTGNITALGAANGIPQTTFDSASGRTTYYFFQRAAFAPDDRTIGWIIGSLVIHTPGQPDVRRGILLITRDGGQTWTRQAVLGAPNNGLDFQPLRDIAVLSKDFQVTTGDNGFIAARKSDTQNFAAVCSFPSGT